MTGAAMKTLFESSTLREALGIMDSIGIGLVAIEGPDGRIVGVLSDGDIRRGLLKGIELKDPVSTCINKKFISVGPEIGRAAVLDLLQARHVRQIPIIDSDGKLVGVHTFERILGVRERPNWAVVMAGGKGERLRPITENIPKPMLTVAGRPILERIVLHLVGHGIRRIFLSVNYLAEMIEDHFGDGAAFGCDIEYIREDHPLGSGGALSLLPRPDHPVIVMNGDLITNTDIGGLLDYHEKGRFLATMCVRPYQYQIPFGCVNIDESGAMASLEEKPVIMKNVNCGIYAISPDAIASIPPNTYFPITNLFETALKDGGRCGCYLIEDEWLDIGQPAELRRARGL